MKMRASGESRSLGLFLVLVVASGFGCRADGPPAPRPAAANAGGTGGARNAGGSAAGGAGVGGTGAAPASGGSDAADGGGDAGDAGTDRAALEAGSGLDDGGDVRLPPEAGGPADAAAGPLALASETFVMIGGQRVFPASASFPMDVSPAFSWTGALPAGTRSLALTFVDLDIDATKWILWNIPPERTSLPAGIGRMVNPPEVPGSMQRGSLGRTGYSGPGVAGPPLRTYEFLLWALDVPTLPGTEGKTTAEIRKTILPRHALGKSPALQAKGQRGGP